jgi:hypothetical protein
MTKHRQLARICIFLLLAPVSADGQEGSPIDVEIPSNATLREIRPLIEEKLRENLRLLRIGSHVIDFGLSVPIDWDLVRRAPGNIPWPDLSEENPLEGYLTPTTILAIEVDGSAPGDDLLRLLSFLTRSKVRFSIRATGQIAGPMRVTSIMDHSIPRE